MLHERPLEENVKLCAVRKSQNDAQRSSTWDCYGIFHRQPETNQSTNLSPKSSQASKSTGCFFLTSCSVCGWTSVAGVLKYSEIREWNAAVAREKKGGAATRFSQSPSSRKKEKKERKEERKKIQHIIKKKKKIQSILLLVATVADGKQL